MNKITTKVINRDLHPASALTLTALAAAGLFLVSIIISPPAFSGDEKKDDAKPAAELVKAPEAKDKVMKKEEHKAKPVEKAMKKEHKAKPEKKAMKKEPKAKLEEKVKPEEKDKPAK